jgi:MoxR-like ATPase
MEERQVTVDGETWPLPDPFFVVATQNPVEHVGTFPLVEGQRDRFGVIVELGHPPRAAERELLLGTGGSDSLDTVRPVCTPHELATAITAIRTVFCTPALADYVIDVVAATRSHHDIVLGASARASLSLLHAAKAFAAIAGRHFVVPDDVQAVATAVLSHRLILAGGADLHASTALVRRLLETTPVPRG